MSLLIYYRLLNPISVNPSSPKPLIFTKLHQFQFSHREFSVREFDMYAVKVTQEATFQCSPGKVHPCAKEQSKNYEPLKILLVFSIVLF